MESEATVGAGIAMSGLDWGIVFGLLAVLLATLILSQRYVKTAADFLVANRCAGRYLLTITSGVAGIGAISIIASFEQYYVSGFSPIWWNYFLWGPIILIMTITGWVTYRFRETRCMTMAQFFEVRYSRKFRIFSGICGWVSGVLNYGIFPAVSVKFFMFFCNLPDTFHPFGLPIEFSTYVCLLIFCIGLGVVFAIFGGQIAIMLTDFIQGLFCNVAFLILLVYLLYKFDWDVINGSLITYSEAHPGESLFNPYQAEKISDFNIWFFLMGIVINILARGVWQGSSGYAAAASSAHESKMAGFLANWRSLVEMALLVFIPVCAVVFFTNPEYAQQATAVNEAITQLKGTDVSQARVPLFLSYILPSGLVGVFAAMMFAAMLSTDDTYMHSWGTIFVQDVIMPFRKKPFTEKQHLMALRYSIIFVGVFAFFFSWLFKQTEYILLFFQITGAIFTGGAGAVLIGGLYSKVGSTLGAWVAMIFGSAIAILSIIVQQLWAGILAPFLMKYTNWQWVANNPDKFPLNSMILAFSITILGFGIYFLVSYFERKVTNDGGFNLDRMLHRGDFDTTGEHADAGWAPGKIFRLLGLTKEFTCFDRVIFFASLAWTGIWFLVFIVGSVAEFFGGWSPAAWLGVWKSYVMVCFWVGLVTTVWFLIGGLFDVKAMFKSLSSKLRNLADDGSVVNGKNSGE